MKDNNKALIISGGGMKGAWGGGLAKGLYENGNKYKIIVGTSTGSLLAPMIALEDFDTLKEVYTSVNNEDIFNVNPFTENGKINIWNALWRLIRKKNTLGETKNLLSLIKHYFTYERFISLLEKDVEVVVCVYNLSKYQAEYYSNKKCTYDDFCNWIWVSACSPVYMSLYEKNGDIYTDGGVGEHVPISYAYNLGYRDFDVIVHRPLTKQLKQKPKNYLETVMLNISCVSFEISKGDIESYKILPDVKLRDFYMEIGQDENSLMFDEEYMYWLWEEGYNKTKNIL